MLIRSYLLSFLLLTLIYIESAWFPSLAFAQQASSLCVVTKVGNPSVSPSLPPGCGAIAGGNYHFPLESPAVITGIFTEMATYAGDFMYQGHVEHAGLDIGTPDNGHGPVYAITDGEVIEVGGEENSCTSRDDGCSVSLKHATDSFISRYTHIDPVVELGEQVKAGQLIGHVHVWLSYDNDHLHFEMKLQENNYNINPRNYFPELEQFPPAPGYNGDVRAWAASRGIFLLDDGKAWAEMFRDHPPCSYTGCWAL